MGGRLASDRLTPTCLRPPRSSSGPSSLDWGSLLRRDENHGNHAHRARPRPYRAVDGAGCILHSFTALRYFRPPPSSVTAFVRGRVVRRGDRLRVLARRWPTRKEDAACGLGRKSTTVTPWTGECNAYRRRACDQRRIGTYRIARYVLIHLPWPLCDRRRSPWYGRASATRARRNPPLRDD